MIKVNILEILQTDDRNLSYLAKHTGLNYSALHKLANNETKSISFDTLEKVCNFLEVSIGDIIQIVPDNSDIK